MILRPMRYTLYILLRTAILSYHPADQTCLPVQKLYTVCDVAMHIIMSKSTTYSLESPKDPVLPSRFFTKPDKVCVCTHKHSPEK